MRGFSPRPHTASRHVPAALLIVMVGSFQPSPGEAPEIADLDDSDASWLVRAQRHIAEREYWASSNREGLQAPNRAHNLRTYFEPTRVRVHDRTAEGSPRLVEMRLHGIGRGDALRKLPVGEVVGERNRVEIRREGLVEWYVNGPDGLDQGFTLSKRPEGDRDLVLEIALSGADMAVTS